MSDHGPVGTVSDMTFFRVITALLLATTVGLTTSGCQKSSYSCKNGVCSVSLSGAGSSTDLGGSGAGPVASELSLVGASDGEAELEYAGQTGTCQDNQTIVVGGLTMTCTQIGDDSVDLVNVN